MDVVLQSIVEKLEAYIGGLIDVADMPEEDRAALKGHLKAAEDILVRNGNEKLRQALSEVTAAVLGRFF